MSIKIDKEKCIGCSACVSVCPDSYEMKDDGKAEIIKDSDCAMNAVDVCPTQAIA